MAAIADGVGRGMKCFRVFARLRGAVADGFELADIRAGAKRLSASTTQYDAAQFVVRVAFVKGVAQAGKQRQVHRIPPFRLIENDRCNCTFAFD
jgi:hypothetical protein